MSGNACTALRTENQHVKKKLDVELLVYSCIIRNRISISRTLTQMGCPSFWYVTSCHVSEERILRLHCYDTPPKTRISAPRVCPSGLLSTFMWCGQFGLYACSVKPKTQNKGMSNRTLIYMSNFTCVFFCTSCAIKI